MVADSQQTQKTLYETDYYLWVIETIKQLQNQELEAIDWENLIDEVSDLSRREKRKLQSLFKRLLEHLLKLKYWEDEAERNRRHWRGEIANFRQQIKYQLEDSPSLNSYLKEIFAQSYRDARVMASEKSGLPLSTFPSQPIARFDQILDENWLP